MENLKGLYAKLLEDLECSVCTNYMAPPIRQCVTGHSLCDPCKRKLPKCPLCQGLFSGARNISLEALASKMEYPCINKSYGCRAQLNLENKDAHEKNCSFAGFKCGVESCPWIGKQEDLVEHWASKKTFSKMYNQCTVCHTKIRSESLYVNLVQAHGELFWFKAKMEMGRIFWAMQLISHLKKPTDYYYEIEILKPGFPHKKIIFSDCCQNIMLSNSDLFTMNVCIASNIDSIHNFIGEDNVIIYYIRVYQAQGREPPSSGARSTTREMHWKTSKYVSNDTKGSEQHKNRKYKKNTQQSESSESNTKSSGETGPANIFNY